MEIIRKKTTLNNLSFNLFLTHKVKNLGLLEDISTNMSVKGETNTILTNASSKLSSVRSFDYNVPYKVGVNGVQEVNPDGIKYVIDGVTYTTNPITLETKVELTKVEQIYDNVNFIRAENNLALTDRISVENSVDIERPALSIIENFSKIQQINNPDELYGFSNNFYKVYNETL